MTCARVEKMPAAVQNAIYQLENEQFNRASGRAKPLIDRVKEAIRTDLAGLPEPAPIAHALARRPG